MFLSYMFTSLCFLLLSLIYLFMSFICMKFNSFYLIKISLNSMIFLDLNFYILLDWISNIFMFTVFFISSMVIFYSYMYMYNEKKNIYFLILMILFVSSMNFLVICPNLIISILGWDGLGLISFCLIIFYNNESSNYSGILTVMTNRLGDIGLILSIILMTNFFSWDLFTFSKENKLIYFMIFFLLLASTTKSAQLPFSAWLPAAMAAPTPVSSLVHSSTLVTAGVYLIIRTFMYFSNQFFSESLMICSILTMLLAGLSAFFEMDMKKIIALSTLSQLGVMMLILSTKNFELAFFHLLTHAMFKASLFLCAGAIIHSSLNWQDIRHISLMFKLSPSISSCLLITNLSLMGFPFLSGFYSKDLILEYMYICNNSFIMLILIILSTMLTSTYSLRLLIMMFKSENSSITSNFHDNLFINTPIMFMCFIVIMFGSFLNWVFFINPIFIFLNMTMKILNLIIISSSFLLFYTFFMKINKNKFPFNFYSFLGKMWFIENISLISTLMKPHNKFIHMNMESWIELSSNKIFIKEMDYINIYLSNFFMNSFKSFIKISFIILILFFYFYKIFY
uniref:NADH:ubiquinone reductase (H(+)-translocating) n=1 Tax=Laelaps sp. TaxID=3081785 RepID=A0AAU6QDT9_9ACAR